MKTPTALSVPTAGPPDARALGARMPTAETPAQEAAEQFEELLLFELLKVMRSTIPEGPDGSGGFARSTLDGMFDQAVAESTAGQLGIAPLLTREFGGSAPPAPAPQTPLALHSTHRHASPTAAATMAGAWADALPQPGDTPVIGRESSPYGWRTNPITGERQFHGGLDIAAPKGEEIRAVERGTVVTAGRTRGYGNTVEIRHPDGVVTRYAHASRIHVRVGDRVEVGEAVADVGSTGQSTGPHLHFEARRNGHTIDPQRYLQRLRRAYEQDSSGRPRAGVTPVTEDLARLVKDEG